MKKIRTISKVATIIAFVAFANVAFATGNLKVNILPLDSDKAVVAISNNTGSTFQISIENKYGDVVFYKETSDPATDYSKIYDFSKLEKGDYSLHVAIDGEKISRNFSIGKDNILVGATKSVVEPFFSYANNVLKISYLNFSGKNVNITFYNNAGLVSTKSAGAKFNLNKGFDVSKLAAGDYSVTLSADNDEYSYNFTVK